MGHTGYACMSTVRQLAVRTSDLSLSHTATTTTNPMQLEVLTVVGDSRFSVGTSTATISLNSVGL